MKKTLITGGAGFIGSHLARNLVNNGEDVTVISRSNDTRNIEDIIKSVHLEVKDIKEITPKDVEGMDQIFHLAGTVDNYSVENGEPFRDIEINCLGTQTLLESCRLAQSKARILFGSTFFVYGNLKSLPATPDSPTNPLSLYAATRLCGEDLCRIYGKAYGLNPVIARFANVFGPGDIHAGKQKGAFDWMISQAVKGETLRVYNKGDFIRDFIYVTDVAEACRLLADKGEKGKVYDIGKGAVKFADLISTIVDLLPGTKTEFVEPPPHHKNVGTVDFYTSSEDLRNLGWAPKVSLRDGITNTILYYQGLSNPQ